jgi:hypothetical protein
LGFWLSCGDRNHRRLSHRQPNRLSDWSDVGAHLGWSIHRYLMTNPTMIQARAATTTLPANTSGTKRPQLILDQAASSERLSGHIARCERPLPRRLSAAPLASVSGWSKSEAMNQHGRHGPPAKPWRGAGHRRPRISSWEAGRPIVEERQGVDLIWIWLPQSDSISERAFRPARYSGYLDCYRAVLHGGI